MIGCWISNFGKVLRHVGIFVVRWLRCRPIRELDHWSQSTDDRDSNSDWLMVVDEPFSHWLNIILS